MQRRPFLKNAAAVSVVVVGGGICRAHLQEGFARHHEHHRTARIVLGFWPLGRENG